MKWDFEDLRVFLDVSTYCNAGCPQCHRTNENGLGKVDWLPLIQWDLKTFKKAFPPEELKNIKETRFCGTWGDPVMCKELDLMFKYIVENSEKTKITVNTNGSIRDEEWWWNIGVTCGERLHVTFDIDGVDQEMHEKYRRFTDLQKVLDNMLCLSQTSANVYTQTVLFKHNQEYKEQIKALAKEYGSKAHNYVTSDRFKYGSNKRYFTNENGEEEYLERADLLEGAKPVGSDNPDLQEQIICRWAKPLNEVVINPDGQVLPCCYHANVHLQGRMLAHKSRELHDHIIYKEEYNKDLKLYNIFHTPLSQIMQSKWYTKTLPNSINTDNPVWQCATQCSNKIKKIHEMRLLDET